MMICCPLSFGSIKAFESGTKIHNRQQAVPLAVLCRIWISAVFRHTAAEILQQNARGQVA